MSFLNIFGKYQTCMLFIIDIYVQICAYVLWFGYKVLPFEGK